MNDTVQQDKEIKNAADAAWKNEIKKTWLIYVGLIGSAVLSIAAGFLLPIKPDASGALSFTTANALIGLYYAIGFAVTGEAAVGFWYKKLTDYDKDNNTQIWIAGLMLVVGIVTSAITAIAAGTMIAYIFGIFPVYNTVPVWVQEWVVYAIPTLFLAHAISGIVFDAVSDTASAKRYANAKIRQINAQIQIEQENARLGYWIKNAPDVARQMGEEEAEAEIAQRRALHNQKMQGSVATRKIQYAQDVDANPTKPSGQN